MSWPFPNRICELLGIEVPIVQSGMAGVAGPDLAAAVCNAGALGILAGHNTSLIDIQAGVKRIRELTRKPFGVNLLMPNDLASPAPAASISSETIQQVQAAINSVREELDIPKRFGLPAEPAHDLSTKLDWLLSQDIPVLSFGLGNPGPAVIDACKRRGIRTMAMVTTAEDARAVEAAGVDILVAQGSEAGGHRSHFEKPADPRQGLVGSMSLIPEIVDTVSIPVLAAGGIADGRGFAGALCLGAEGVLLGTRFVATRESMVNQAYKQAVLDAAGNDISITDAFSGRYARVIRNRLLDRYEASGAPVLPYMWQASAVADVLDAARAADRAEYMALWSGQSSGLVHDLPSAGEVVERLTAECLQVLNNWR